jgi:hypothetical protein
LGVAFYALVAQDVQGCRDTVSVQVTGPLALFTAVDSLQPVRCAGEASGQLWVQTSGGIAPYAYSLDGISFGPAQTILDSVLLKNLD